MENEHIVKRAVLEQIGAELSEAGVPASYVENSEPGGDFLQVFYSGIESLPDTVSAQYFFPDFNGPENVLYFCSLLVLDPDADEDKLADKLTKINKELACGVFLVLKDIGLCFKLTVPVTTIMSEEAFYKEIDLLMGHAQAMCFAYAKELMRG